MVDGPQFGKGPSPTKINTVIGIVSAFCDQIRKEMLDLGADMDAAGQLNSADDCSVENLLAQRKALVSAVEEGMLERKDQETKIGLFAALIWFNRLEEDRKARINSFG